jgi:hypothetical protein
MGLKAQESSNSDKYSFIRINSEFSYKMLEPNEDQRKVNIFISERQKGYVESGSVVIGSSLIGIVDYQVSNTNSKFGYLMRHPTATNQIGTEVSEAVIHSFQLSATGMVNS